MLRRRLLREPQWGQPSFAQRLWRMRPLSALVVSLPAIVLCAWYAWLGLLAHLGHQAELKLQEPLTVGLFQLHLHDLLVRDWQRLSMPEPKRSSALPTLGLAVDGDKLDELDRRLPPNDGLSYYVDAFLVRNNRAHEVQVRYRGGKYWHYRHPQKSWKVRAKDGKPIGGFETFSLLSTPEAVPFEEEIILQIAREQGLLTPEYFPVRLLLNKSYMGVYFFEAQPDAGLLRRAGRAAGSVYSGSEAPIDPESGVSTLFRSADHFTKVAQGIHQKLGERTELTALVRAINATTVSEFDQYASRHLDLDKFAAFDAIDVTFGCNQHDFGDNHKLYFDPYRDRFEPIAWNFRGCKHEPEFNRTDNPLLLRMKQIPGYLARRNRIVYQLLRGAGATESLRERTRTFLDTLQPDQASDRYWDGNQLLPAISPYYSQLLRPLNRDLQNIVIETRLYELRQRNQFLTDSLEKHAVQARLFACSRAQEPKPGTDDSSIVCAIDVTVGGDSSYRLLRIEPSWAIGCKPRYWQLFSDNTLDDRLQLDGDDTLDGNRIESAAASPAVEMFPGVRFATRRLHPTRGRIRTVSEPRRYRFFLRTPSCESTSARLALENTVTGAVFSTSAVVQARTLAVEEGNSCSDTYREEPGYSSPHSWCLPRQRPEVIHLGPGTLEISQTRVFSARESVVIAPGTTLRMATGTSLVFYGRLEASGRPEAPIHFESSGQGWGGIAIQGPDASGSRLSHVTVAGGSHPDSGGPLWPGVVNIHDAEDVNVDHCSLESPRSQVGLHVAGVRNLVWRDSRFSDLPGNAVELKYSSATLDHLKITNAGRGGVVCAGSQAALTNSRIVGTGECAITAGQVTTLTVQDTLIANADCGLHALEASTLEQQRVLLYRDVLGARVEPNDDRFPGKARLKGNQLFAVGCQIPFVGDNKRQKDEPQIVTHLLETEFQTLRTRVLEIHAWDELDESITGWRTGVMP